MSDTGVMFTNGYAPAGEDQKSTKVAANAAAKSPLGDKRAFTEDMECLGDQGIVPIWAETQAVHHAFGVSESGNAADKELEKARSVAGRSGPATTASTSPESPI